MDPCSSCRGQAQNLWNYLKEARVNLFKIMTTVIMRGHCQKGEIRVGFGDVKSTLLKTT